MKIPILASFSYQAFIFTHFPIILRKKNFRFIGTLTDLPFDLARVKLLCRGFSFTPAPSPDETEIRTDLKEFRRKLRLREYFLDSNQEPRLVSNESDFVPPKERDEELDELIEDVMSMNVQTQSAKDNLTKAERNSLQQLKTNKDIVIKEADKGGVAVIMTKNQYQSMVMTHLNSDAYEHIQDKNIDKKVMQKIEEFTNNYSDILEEWEIE